MRGEAVYKGAFVFFMGVIIGGIGLKYYAKTPEQIMEPVALSELKYIKEKLQIFADTEIQSYLTEKSASLRQKKADVLALKTVQVLVSEVGINIPGAETLVQAAAAQDAGAEHLDEYKKIEHLPEKVEQSESDLKGRKPKSEDEVLTKDQALKLAKEKAVKDKVDVKLLDKMELKIEQDSTLITFMWSPKNAKQANWDYSVTVDKHTKEVSAVTGTIEEPPAGK